MRITESQLRTIVRDVILETYYSARDKYNAKRRREREEQRLMKTPEGRVQLEKQRQERAARAQQARQERFEKEERANIERAAAMDRSADAFRAYNLRSNAESEKRRHEAEKAGYERDIKARADEMGMSVDEYMAWSKRQTQAREDREDDRRVSLGMGDGRGTLTRAGERSAAGYSSFGRK